MKLLRLILKEKPQKADVIVWLQGERYDRGQKVISLFKRGFAKKILISGNNVPSTMKRIPGVDYEITLIKLAEWLKKRGVKSKQIIIDDKSFNTADQAENVLSMAKKKDWKRIILVASLHHQVRVFLTFLARIKKTGWRGRIINQPNRISWYRIPGGRDKNVIGIIFEEIKKIKQYKFQVATFKEGLEYFRKNTNG